MLLALSTIVLALPSGRPGDLLSSWSTVRQAVNACGNRSCSMGIVSMLVDSQILITNGTNVHLFSAPGQRAELIGGASRFFLVSNGAKLTLTGIILTNGSAPLRGGAVKVMGGSTLNLNAVCIDGCRTNEGNGGAIYEDEASTLNIRDSILSSNKASLGGAIAAHGRSTFSIIRTNISNNVAGGIYRVGGALYLNNNAQGTIQGSRFYLNTAWQGGAAYLFHGSSLVITECWFTQGHVGWGSALEIASQDVTVIVTASHLVGDLFVDGKIDVFDSFVDGSFQGSGYWAACPPGTFTNAQVALQQSEKKGQTGSCEPCPLGTHTASRFAHGSQRCTNCSAGLTTLKVGANSSASCIRSSVTPDDNASEHMSILAALFVLWGVCILFLGVCAVRRCSKIAPVDRAMLTEIPNHTPEADAPADQIRADTSSRSSESPMKAGEDSDDEVDLADIGEIAI
jgi:hypothetical protein